MQQQLQIQFRPVGLEIIIKDSIKELETEVSTRLESGNWMLHGDWVILQSKEGAQYAQAMAKMAFKPLKLPENLTSNILSPTLVL
jgi:hypothetical protein